MNFKRYNGRTWETVRHKLYGSGTDSLTAFPAMIQASGEPLTDYTIYGNIVQNGTPTPEAPVDVVGCGGWDATVQQYKLSITVNVTEHPIYLGQVETTRRIKKWVIDGTENWSKGNYSPSGGYQFFAPKPSDIANNPDWLTTHFKKGNVLNGSAFASYLSLYPEKSILPENATANDFKAWLAQKYQNGTPVTIWYVLATPEAAIVNEPLHKIGDYADTITMAQADVTIPTSDGDNIISFDTSVQPSAMSATFKGWHAIPAPKTYDGNDWS